MFGFYHFTMDIDIPSSVYSLNTPDIRVKSPLHTMLPKAGFLQFFNDVFEKSKGNEIIDRVPIKDLAGYEHQGVVIRRKNEEAGNFSNSEIYSLNINGAEKGRITISDNDKRGFVIVETLCANKEGSKEFKGVGTELLKVAVKRSLDKGFGGRLALIAAHKNNPVGFYYKNNFRFYSKSDDKSAELLPVVDYAVRHNIPPDSIEGFPNAIPMELDEIGAKALLNDVRLYEHSRPLMPKGLAKNGISFGGSVKSKGDNFDKIEITVPASEHREAKAECTFLENITLKDIKGNNVNALLLQNKADKNNYYVAIKKDNEYKGLCRMHISDTNDFIFIDSLYGQNNEGEYKGAGTELIKYAVNLSRQKGHNGRIRLLAAGSFPFCYKNNFRIADPLSSAYRYISDFNDFDNRASMDALMNCAARSNSGCTFDWPLTWEKPELELTEDAADALMRGERLYLDDEYETMYKGDIVYNDGKYKRLLRGDMIFCKAMSSNGAEKYVVQFVQKNDTMMQWLGSAEISMVEDDFGDKYMDIDIINLNDTVVSYKGDDAIKAIKEELLKAAKIKADEFGVMVKGAE